MFTRNEHAILIDKFNHSDAGDPTGRIIAGAAMIHFMFRREFQDREKWQQRLEMLYAAWKSSLLDKRMKRAIFHNTKPLGCIWI